MAKIAILGAGLLGRLASLCYGQHQLTFFEPKKLSTENQTGLIAAAMVAPTAESAIASQAVVKLGVESLTLWPEFLSYFGWQDLFHQSGSIVLAHQADTSALTMFINQIKTNTYYALTSHHLARKEPELRFLLSNGYFLDQEAHIDNCLLYKNTSDYIQQRQFPIIETSIQANASCLSTFDLVLDCRGLGAKEETSNPLRGVRGEIIKVHASEVSLTRPIRLIHPRYPIYVVPKPENHYVIGATEIESESQHKITVRSTLELLSAAYSVHKGFAEAAIVQTSTGLRPAYIDNEPNTTFKGKVVQINGLYRHGFMIAPALLKQLTSEISHQFGIHCQPQIEKIFRSNT